MKCAICGAEFEPYRSTQKYCSRECRNRFYLLKYYYGDKARCIERRKRWMAKNRDAINYQHKVYRITGRVMPIAKARTILDEMP